MKWPPMTTARNKQNKRNGEQSNHSTRFNTDGIKDNILQCYSEITDKQQFLKRMGALEELVHKVFTYPHDVASVHKFFAITPLIQPRNLSKKECAEDIDKKMIWEALMKTYMKRFNLLKSNTCRIYTIVLG